MNLGFQDLSTDISQFKICGNTSDKEGVSNELVSFGESEEGEFLGRCQGHCASADQIYTWAR